MSATVFFGTSEFASAVLARLAASEHRPELVVTRPDRPRGRGRRAAAPPVADLSRELGIELAQPAAPGDALAAIDALAPRTICVCAYGAIIREPLLSLAPMLNVHPSLLPRWRGAAPIERALMAGDKRTGVSIMRLTAGLDSGPVCLQESVAIGAGESYGSLASRLQELGADLLLRALGDPQLAFEPQAEEGATYAEKIGSEEKTLDAACPAAELERRVRALHPHLGARTPDGLRVLEARTVADTDATGAAPGELRSSRGRLFYGPGLELLRVQPPGGRPMSAAEFMRGHAL